MDEQLDHIIQAPTPLVAILMGSPSDEAHCKEIAKHVVGLGLTAQLRVCSAHKGTKDTLNILAEYEGSGDNVR